MTAIKKKLGSILSKVTKGKIRCPHLLLIYGPDGVGKSSFGASAPSPIFLGPEKGTAFMDVARFPELSTFRDILAGIDELLEAEHEYETLVIDSLDWVEPLVWAHVCEENDWKSIEDPGFGKGYGKSLEAWRNEFISRLARLHQRMNIILIAHSTIRLFQDPNKTADYDRYQLKLNEKAGALFREFVDAVLFANFEVHTHKDKNERKAKAFGDGKRLLYTERRPSFDAKNRQGLPFEISLSWDAYIDAAEGGQKSKADDMIVNIKQLLTNVTDENIKKLAKEKVKLAGKDPHKLSVIQNRLRTAVAG